MLASSITSLAAVAHKAPNARQFYDDAATVIPILLLAVIYQSRNLHPVPGAGLASGMAFAALFLVIVGLGEFECLHVAAGYDPTERGKAFVAMALLLSGGLAVAEPLTRFASAWNERPQTRHRLSLRKNKGYRALVICVAVTGILMLVLGLPLGAEGKPTAKPHHPSSVAPKWDHKAR